MTKQIIKSLTMLTLLVVLSFVTTTPTTNAQTSKRVVANIPFEFTVGDKELPAGTYSVEPTTGGSVAMRIVGTEKSAFRLSSLLLRANSDKGKMVFHRYGNHYFLTEIWGNGEVQGRKLNQSSAETAIQRELAANKTRNERYQRVELALAR